MLELSIQERQPLKLYIHKTEQQYNITEQSLAYKSNHLSKELQTIEKPSIPCVSSLFTHNPTVRLITKSSIPLFRHHICPAPLRLRPHSQHRCPDSQLPAPQFRVRVSGSSSSAPKPTTKRTPNKTPLARKSPSLSRGTFRK
jgi:hypothetical protein